MTSLSYPFPRSGLDAPLELYARLRAECPVAPIILRDGSDAFVVTRYSDARQVLQDPRFSRAALSKTVGAEMVRWTPTRSVDIDSGHTPPYRLAAQEALSPRAVERLRSQTRDVAHRLLANMLRRGPPGDLIGGFARPLSLTVVGDLIGLPHRSREWVMDRVPIATAVIPTQASQEAIGELTSFLVDLLAQRRRVRCDDLISRLLNAQEDDPAAVTDSQLNRLVLLLCLGGLHTFAASIGIGVPILLRQPDHYSALADPSAETEKLVEEVLRLACPSPSSAPRLALADVQLGETLIRRGSVVLVCLESANLDEDRFPDPGRLNLEQASRLHTTFGLGANMCVGAALARMELQEGLTALARLVPSLRLAVAESEIVYRHRAELLAPDIAALEVTWSTA